MIFDITQLTPSGDNTFEEEARRSIYRRVRDGLKKKRIGCASFGTIILLHTVLVDGKV